MKLLIDTNIIVDFLADREPFAAHSERVIEMCIDGYAEGLLTASSVTDIYYIMRKVSGREAALKRINSLLEILDVVSVGKAELIKAMELDIPDYEDALAAICAKRVKADYIVTRNIKDFKNSSVKAITPKELLQLQ